MPNSSIVSGLSSAARPSSGRASAMVDAKAATMAVDRGFALCARCHRKILGRPEQFPQVVLEQHVQGPVQGAVCLDCHDPHSPKL